MKTGLRFSFLYIDNRKRVAVCFAKMKVECLSLVVFCLQSAMSQWEISEVERFFDPHACGLGCPTQTLSCLLAWVAHFDLGFLSCPTSFLFRVSFRYFVLIFISIRVFFLSHFIILLFINYFVFLKNLQERKKEIVSWSNFWYDLFNICTLF